jgi:hypothetical protein
MVDARVGQRDVEAWRQLDREGDVLVAGSLERDLVAGFAALELGDVVEMPECAALLGLDAVDLEEIFVGSQRQGRAHAGLRSGCLELDLDPHPRLTGYRVELADCRSQQQACVVDPAAVGRVVACANPERQGDECAASQRFTHQHDCHPVQMARNHGLETGLYAFVWLACAKDLAGFSPVGDP